MPPRPRHSEQVKNLVVQCHLQNPELSYAKIGERYGMAKSTVIHIIKKFEQKGTVQNIGVSGSQRSTSAVADRHIVSLAKKEPFSTCR